MKRLGLTLLLLLGLVRASPPPEDSTKEILSFHDPWSKFFKEYFGCPRSPRDLSECHPAEGIWDMRSWASAKREAMKLFNLKEK
jgi:hypothetical protein